MEMKNKKNNENKKQKLLKLFFNLHPSALGLGWLQRVPSLRQHRHHHLFHHRDDVDDEDDDDLDDDDDDACSRLERGDRVPVYTRPGLRLHSDLQSPPGHRHHYHHYHHHHYHRHQHRHQHVHQDDHHRTSSLVLVQNPAVQDH